MKLNEQQKRIIFHLKRHHMTIDEMTAVLLHLENDKQQQAMINYLLTHPTELPREVVDKAVALGKSL